ncbi:MAG TPA: hypothetical protein VEL69_06255 [Ktedonobacteraceae bacterium]|nr:hypothetical protein [Ktedonobacteraceae bacterium]
MIAKNSLTPKQQIFITAYLTPGLTIEAAAKVAGIAEITGYRYLKMEHVQAGIKQARAELYEQAMGGLLHLVDKAVKTLDGAMDRAEFPGTQVRASQIVLERTHETIKVNEIEKRIAELEQLLQGNNGGIR